MFQKQCFKTLLKLKPLGIAGKNIQWCVHCGRQYGGSFKNQTEKILGRW